MPLRRLLVLGKIIPKETKHNIQTLLACRYMVTKWQISLLMALFETLKDSLAFGLVLSGGGVGSESLQ